MCEQVAPVLASEGFLQSRPLANSGEGVRHSLRRGRKSEYVKSFLVGAAKAFPHLLQEEVAFNCGRETDWNGVGVER